MTVKQPIRQKVLEQLLTGEPIRCKAFATKHHAAASHVVQTLLALHVLKMVDRVETVGGAGGHSVAYHPSDMTAIRKELARVKNGLAADPVDFTGLLQAWGMKLADIALPTFRHELRGEWA